MSSLLYNLSIIVLIAPLLARSAIANSLADGRFNGLQKRGEHNLSGPGADARGQEPDSLAVRRAALAWLGLLDREQYTASFDSAAPLLRQIAGSASAWEQFARQARSNLRAPADRRLVASVPDPDLPGAPAGRYWRLVFEVINPAGPTETVVLQHTSTGWRVAMFGRRGP
jgi:hypothetical protein